MLNVIGIGEWKASGKAEDQIVTHALGSCLGITAYDPAAQVGGMVHVMLPQPASDSAADGIAHPGKYVGPGLEAMLCDCLRLGAQKDRLVLTASGGTSSKIDEKDDFFQIGRRNIAQLRKVLWASGLLLKAQDVGGTSPRTLTLDIATGAVLVKINGTALPLIQGRPNGEHP